MTEFGSKLYLAAAKMNNTDDLFKQIYQIDSDEVFDAIVVAPSWLPEKIMKNYAAKITVLTRHAYFSSYLVECNQKRIAWVQCASGANNLIDTMISLGKSKTEKIIFIGAVGALKNDIRLGELVTPSFSLAFEGGSLYTYPDFNIANFGKKITPDPLFLDAVLRVAKEKQINLQVRSVYCTDSVLCEYFHLDYINAYNCDLIEMETAAFYRSIELIGKKGIALLVVSDNSATGVSLIKRTEEENRIFYRSREVFVPELILGLCDL